MQAREAREAIVIRQLSSHLNVPWSCPCALWRIVLLPLMYLRGRLWVLAIGLSAFGGEADTRELLRNAHSAIDASLHHSRVVFRGFRYACCIGIHTPSTLLLATMRSVSLSTVTL
jgi:hypothetical protein